MSAREPYVPGSDHLTVTGKFQSDKYGWCEPDFLPLKFTDPKARDLMAEYAKRVDSIDPEFAADIRTRLGEYERTAKSTLTSRLTKLSVHENNCCSQIWDDVGDYIVARAYSHEDDPENEGVRISTEVAIANARRLAACTTACAGIRDPEQVIQHLRDSLGHLLHAAEDIPESVKHQFTGELRQLLSLL